ncbi:YozQ family protein [Bacillus sp. REN10]|uniref:YozQ family protein n=1 Tax=Bacillus sp. REN10 TaxID=2782541 RepID=UPI001EEE9DDE|nr:YozQ family protein [Bacillus sp. REN10]
MKQKKEHGMGSRLMNQEEAMKAVQKADNTDNAMDITREQISDVYNEGTIDQAQES